MFVVVVVVVVWVCGFAMVAVLMIMSRPEELRVIYISVTNICGLDS